MPYSVIVLIIITAGFAAVAVYGGITGSEAMLAVGLEGALVCLLLIPAFAVRAKRRRKIRERQDALICFEYSFAEAQEIASAARPVILKRSIRISAAISICIAFIFMPFVLFSLQPGSTLPPMLPFAIACVVLPWLSVPIAPAATTYNIRKAPCISFVGHNCILIANRYLGINDRCALEADGMRFEAGKNGGMTTLHVRYCYRAGRVPTKIQHWVQVPVPRGREQEAVRVCAEFRQPEK